MCKTRKCLKKGDARECYRRFDSVVKHGYLDRNYDRLSEDKNPDSNVLRNDRKVGIGEQYRSRDQAVQLCA